MFGLTGDLGEKKLFPALYELQASGRLGIPVIGVGRTEHSDDDVRSMLDASLEDFAPSGGGDVDRDVVAAIDLSYLSGDSTDESMYARLLDRVGDVAQPVVYAALPPGIFGDVARGIDAGAFPDTTRLVVEKPFGSDADTARRLYDEITDSIDPDRLFIVDHFLAKSAIENMLTVRTTNALIDNSLRNGHVASIDIVMSETGGVDGRGSFYESVGAIDDVLQNHLLQLLAVLTMEEPADDSDESYHAARADVLRAVRPFSIDSAVVGQFDGYRELDDVADDSTVETYVSATTSIDVERWSGVPVTIRTGKKLADDSTIATITLTNSAPADDAVANRVRFTVKPNPSVSFDIAVLDAGSHDPTPTTIYACGPVDHGELGDYAVMLDNAMNGDTRHFAQIDDVVAAWGIVAPLKDADLELRTYAPGSDGPGPAR